MSFTRMLVAAITVVALFASTLPVEACPLLPFGARARRADRQEARQVVYYGKAGLGCSGAARGPLRVILPPYGR